MSHVHDGPLATYNSLLDPHLHGYFSNTHIRRHLRKAWLVNRNGEVISESKYRLLNSRSTHRKRVREMLASAIVNKAVEEEQMRQKARRNYYTEIERLKRIEQMKKRKNGYEETVLTLLRPRSVASARHSQAASRSMSARSSQREKESARPQTVLGIRASSIQSLDERSGQRSVPHSARSSTLDSYRSGASSANGRRAGSSTCSSSQRSITPRSPYGRISVDGIPGQCTPRDGYKLPSSLHRIEPAYGHQSEPKTLCEIRLKYLGLRYKSEYFFEQEVQIEQQICGGNSVTIFRRKLRSDTEFTITSRRHRGFPFGISIFIDGRMDVQISSCCEYKHRAGTKLGGKAGHFMLVSISGAVPCYKCERFTNSSTEEESDSKEKNSSSEENETRSVEEENKRSLDKTGNGIRPSSSKKLECGINAESTTKPDQSDISNREDGQAKIKQRESKATEKNLSTKINRPKSSKIRRPQSTFSNSSKESERESRETTAHKDSKSHAWSSESETERKRKVTRKTEKNSRKVNSDSKENRSQVTKKSADNESKISGERSSQRWSEEEQFRSYEDEVEPSVYPKPSKQTKEVEVEVHSDSKAAGDNLVTKPYDIHGHPTERVPNSPQRESSTTPSHDHIKLSPTKLATREKSPGTHEIVPEQRITAGTLSKKSDGILETEAKPAAEIAFSSSTPKSLPDSGIADGSNDETNSRTDTSVGTSSDVEGDQPVVKPKQLEVESVEAVVSETKPVMATEIKPTKLSKSEETKPGLSINDSSVGVTGNSKEMDTEPLIKRQESITPMVVSKPAEKSVSAAPKARRHAVAKIEKIDATQKEGPAPATKNEPHHIVTFPAETSSDDDVVEDAKKAVSNLTEDSFEATHLNKPAIKKLIKQKFGRKVRQVLISSSDLKGDYGDRLFKWISATSQLRELTITGCDVQNAHLTSLQELIQSSHSLLKLCLIDMNTSDSKIKMLLQPLAERCQVTYEQKLQLKAQRVVAKAVQDAVRSESEASLADSRKSSGELSAEQSILPKLGHLELINCGVGNAALEEIIQMLSGGALEYLSLRNNRHVTQYGWKHLLQRANQTTALGESELKSLDLSYNSIGRYALQQIPGLQLDLLDMSSCNITDQQLADINIALKGPSTQIKELKLENDI